MIIKVLTADSMGRPNRCVAPYIAKLSPNPERITGVIFPYSQKRLPCFRLARGRSCMSPGKITIAILRSHETGTNKQMKKWAKNVCDQISYESGASGQLRQSQIQPRSIWSENLNYQKFYRWVSSYLDDLRMSNLLCGEEEARVYVFICCIFTIDPQFQSPCLFTRSKFPNSSVFIDLQLDA
jgi:hypothetical protein